MSISQKEADNLISMRKIYSPRKKDSTEFPSEITTDGIDFLLTSENKQEEFKLIFKRKKIILEKRNHVLLGRNIPLLRLDLDGPIHTNPDGSSIGTNHLHIYKEGYGDKWAYEIPPHFQHLDNIFETFQDFVTYCNIFNIPDLERNLFT